MCSGKTKKGRQLPTPGLVTHLEYVEISISHLLTKCLYAMLNWTTLKTAMGDTPNLFNKCFFPIQKLSFFIPVFFIGTKHHCTSYMLHALHAQRDMFATGHNSHYKFVVSENVLKLF